MEHRIKEESRQYKDIIQVDYPEDYYNCTVKGVALVRWAALHCPFARFIFKFDDDSFMRVNPLLAELERIEPLHIMGLLSALDEVIHTNTSKWFISPQYYPYLFYQAYIRGAYLIPGQFTIRLYEAIVSEPQSKTLPALPFDDVYISGILAAKASISRAYHESFLLVTKGNINDTNEISRYNVHFNMMSPDRMNQLWKIFGEN